MGITSSRYTPRSASKRAGLLLRTCAAVALVAGSTLATGQLNAQTTVAPSAASGVRTGTTLAPVPGPVRPIHQMDAAGAAPVQYMIIDSLFNAFSYYTSEAEPYQYDAASNTLVTIKRGYTGSSDDIFVRRSTDLGMTWEAAKGPLHDNSQGKGRYPSISILNKAKSSDRSTLLYHFTFPVTINDEFGTTFQSFLDGNLQLLGPAVDQAGVNAESGLVTWGTDAHTVFTADGNVAVTAGNLSGNNLGVRRFNPTTGDLAGILPPQLESANFSDPGSPTARTSLVIGLARNGDDATMYMGILSRFPQNETDRRLQPYPAITSSTDGGLTWSALDILPINTIRDYAQQNGANPDSTIFVYNQSQDFVVTGPNEMSFIIPMIEANADVDAPMAQIVEVQRSGSTWSIHKIADYSGRFFTFDLVGDATTRENQMANEAHVSRTADGNFLLAKWVDIVSYIFQEDVNDDGSSPDTVNTTDVFVSVKKKGTNTWSTTKNITETPLLDRITWIAPVIPNDLKNIPMLTVQSKMIDPPLTLVDSIFTRQVNIEGDQYVTIVHFDADALAGVQNETATATSGMTLESSYPNPIAGNGVIRFSVPNAGVASLELWSVRGERVLALVNGRIEAGAHTATVDASHLAPGVYYYTLKMNGESLTRALTVVR